MKLLIVDDEELTRSGLLSSISWSELGITKLYQAADGVYGLALAREHRPDIILCDVRMPRMDGIRMAAELQQFLPDSAIIFMSGYSDKEYLKAAIRLKAVSYVEKPLNTGEIREALLEALADCRERKNALRRESRMHIENAARLALLLTVPYEKNQASITQLWTALRLPPYPGLSFTSFLVKFQSLDLSTDDFVNSFGVSINTFLKSYGLFALITNRYQNFLVIHICGSRKISACDQEEIFAFLNRFMTGCGNFYITCGQREEHLSRAYSSYETSVLLMESCFFFEPGSILTPGSMPQEARSISAAAISPDLLKDFTDALLLKNEKKAKDSLELIYGFYCRNMAALSDQAKETYYRLFTGLDECRTRLKLPVSNKSGGGEKTVIRYLEEFFSLSALHEGLQERTEQFFYDINDQIEEHPTVYLIKCYIRDNYMDEALSVKDVSDYVNRTVSYLCTMFKAETNQTLNQYITEYRIERAKQYLREPRYKITEIAPMVGYSDSNYFGKSFKKTVGISPSEYREKWMI